MKKLFLLALTLLFIGCNETPTLYKSDSYKGEPMQIADGLYFKKVRIQDMYVLLQCDKDGKITHNQNLNASYQDGKVFKHTAILSSSVSEVGGNFIFKCSDINDCYNQVVIVKNSISK